MHILIHIAASMLLLESVQSLHLVPNEANNEESDRKDNKVLRTVLEYLANSKSYLTNDRRAQLNPSKLAKAKSIFEILSRHLASGQLKKFLRGVVPVTPDQPQEVNTEFEQLIEKELKQAENKHNSMLLENAYVEKKGPNDFLVLHPSVNDPFVTIIPNDIYYNIEKKCANWMDDCTVQGIRARLLQKVKSPYKK